MKRRRAITLTSLPRGTVSVGLGLVVAGVMQYGFLAIAARSLGPDRYAPLATFWSLLFVIGPGFFVPLEQEVGRALAARRQRGEGGRPVVLRAAAVGAAIAACLLVLTAAAFPVLRDRIFDGDASLVPALMVGLVLYAAHFLVRGTLSGNGRFATYGLLLGSEGVVRLVLCAVLALAGVRTAGPIGFALVVGSLLAILIVLRDRRGLLLPGPPAPLSEVSSALGYLLLASVCVQFLMLIGPVAVQVLATPAQHAAAGRFLTTRVIAFVPVFLFQAVQAPLLPRLSALVAARARDEFRGVLVRLVAMAVALGGAATVVTTALGPWASRLVFGSGYAVGSIDFALLSASSMVFMLSQLLTAALVAAKAYARTAMSWTGGAMVFVVVAALGGDLFRRVEVGLLCGALATVGLMALSLRPQLRRHTPTG